MSLKGLLKIGREILKAKKPTATPATGQQTKQITYTPKAQQETGQELAIRDIKTPAVVRNVTKELHMGDKIAPAFGSSTYDWIMRKGAAKYTADEWVDWLTSTRKVKSKMFGKPVTETVRDQKRFRYDKGPFAGKEVSISKEELYDSNLAVFNNAGDLTGGLLFAAKKFGLKLDANELGAMVKLNPVNRLRPIELGIPKGVRENFDKTLQTSADQLNSIKRNYATSTMPGSVAIVEGIDDVIYKLGGLKIDNSRSAVLSLRDSLKQVRNIGNMKPNDRKVINKVIGEFDSSAAPLRNNKTFYQDQTQYTLQGGRDYRETIMVLDDAIPTNNSAYSKGGHFSDLLEKQNINNIYHVRFDTRFTPDGKKVFFINEIQSDVNQEIAKNIARSARFDGTRFNPFQADLELKLLVPQRAKLLENLNKAINTQDSNRVNFLSKELRELDDKLKLLRINQGKDYFPFLEGDQYGDHALKYLVQKAAKEGVDYVAIAPFDKVAFRQGFAAGNERFYGYASGKGIGKRGSAVMPDLMKKLARLYNSKAGPTKVSLSDPKLPYKKVREDKFKYESANVGDKAPISPDHPLKGKEIKSTYHSEAYKDSESGTKLIAENDPRLYFDAFAIKVEPIMRGTQKTYKALGGLVVDIFKEKRYN